MNSCLNCEKVQKELYYELPNIDQSLAIMRSQTDMEIESPSLLGIDRINYKASFISQSDIKLI